MELCKGAPNTDLHIFNGETPRRVYDTVMKRWAGRRKCQASGRAVAMSQVTGERPEGSALSYVLWTPMLC